jgi:hypothetical protein
MINELSSGDRTYDLVYELLEEGEDPRDIKERVKEAIQDWRMNKAEE